MDLGVITEYAIDSRDTDATTIYQNDLMLGLRLAANDPASSEILFGFIQDMNNEARALSIEASRRISPNCKLILEAWTFLDVLDDDILTNVQQDDFLRIQIAYYF
jgi:hypothetical protein